MDSKKRIGFTGAGGTGKTTVLNVLDLNEYVRGLPRLSSPTRAVFARWGITEADQESMTPDDKLRLQMEIFSERVSAEERVGDTFLSDRTLLDNYAYCLFRNYERLDRHSLELLESQVQANLKLYTHIFYFPILFDPPSDGFRQVGFAYNRCIDSIIQSFLTRNRVASFVVPMGTPEERARFVLNRIAEG